jgi:hypothetical protein
MTNIYLRIFKEKGFVIVAACDSGVLGKTFREGRLKLEVADRFYKGELCSIEEAVQALQAADIGNLVGGTVVKAAVENGLVDPAAVITIGGVPHVQIIKISRPR